MENKDKLFKIAGGFIFGNALALGTLIATGVLKVKDVKFVKELVNNLFKDKK